MKKVGIVDPTKVTRSALQNAASIASMVLTTESIVTDKKRRKSKFNNICYNIKKLQEAIKMKQVKKRKLVDRLKDVLDSFINYMKLDVDDDRIL